MTIQMKCLSMIYGNNVSICIISNYIETFHLVATEYFSTSKAIVSDYAPKQFNHLHQNSKNAPKQLPLVHFSDVRVIVSFLARL